jgi:hypothetical protein
MASFLFIICSKFTLFWKMEKVVELKCSSFKLGSGIILSLYHIEKASKVQNFREISYHRAYNWNAFHINQKIKENLVLVGVLKLNHNGNIKKRLSSKRYKHWQEFWTNFRSFRKCNLPPVGMARTVSQSLHLTGIFEWEKQLYSANTMCIRWKSILNVN